MAPNQSTERSKVFTINRDYILEGIEDDERYKKEILEIQRLVFISSEPVYHEFNFMISYTDRITGNKDEVSYRFKAQSLKGENNPFTIPDFRALKDANLIIIIAQNINENDRVI